MFTAYAMLSILYFYQTGEHTSFDLLIFIDNAFNISFGVLVFLTQIQLLRILQFNNKMAMVGKTVTRAAKPLMNFSCNFVITYLAMSSLATILFGTMNANFRSMGTTMLYLGTMVLGRVAYREIDTDGRLVARVFVSVYSGLVLWVLTGMLVSIINDAITHVRADATRRKNKFELVDHIVKRFKDTFPFLWDIKGRDKLNGGFNEGTQITIEITKILFFIAEQKII